MVGAGIVNTMVAVVAVWVVCLRRPFDGGPWRLDHYRPLFPVPGPTSLALPRLL